MRYRTIVADPPWDYGNDPAPAMHLLAKPPSFQRYGVMSVRTIAALPVRELAADSAALFLWTTHRYLRDAFDVVDAWGFRYSCTLTWCKEPHPFSYGGTFKSTTEFCLFARRGTGARRNAVDRQWFTWPRAPHNVAVGLRHSAKPEAFLDMVEEACPGPYCELFARRNRLGWSTWGDEALGHVELGAAQP